MSALPIQGIFDALLDAGLRIALAPSGGLVVSPGTRLTHDLRELVKGNKTALVGYLQAANDPAQAMGLIVNPPVAKLVATQTQLSTVLSSESVELPTDPDAWRVLAYAYHAHHFNCPLCIAAGKGHGLRCGTGAALHSTYETAYNEIQTRP